MSLLVDMHNYSSNEEEFRLILGSAVSSLLDLYPPDVYPIRHSRVILSALRLLLEQPTALDSSLVETLLNAGTETLILLLLQSILATHCAL